MMPTIIYTENPDDIRITLRLIASQLTNETMFLVNLDDTPSVEQLIAQLRTFLPQPKAPTEIPKSWAPYDEPVTHEMILELVRTWPEASKTNTRHWAQTNGANNLFDNLVKAMKKLCLTQVPIHRKLYKGHFFHPLINLDDISIKSAGMKSQRLPFYFVGQWKLLPTPTDWVPPDMR